MKWHAQVQQCFYDGVIFSCLNIIGIAAAALSILFFKRTDTGHWLSLPYRVILIFKLNDEFHRLILVDDMLVLFSWASDCRFDSGRDWVSGFFRVFRRDEERRERERERQVDLWSEGDECEKCRGSNLWRVAPPPPLLLLYAFSEPQCIINLSSRHKWNIFYFVSDINFSCKFNITFY